MWLYRDDDGYWSEAIRLKAGDRLIIGRACHCDVVLNDSRVSREHVSIVVKSELVTIEALSNIPLSLSVNGSVATKVTIAEDCVFSIRKHVFRVSWLAPKIGVNKKIAGKSNAVELSTFLTAALQANTPVESLERLLMGLVRLIGACRGYVLLKAADVDELKPLATYKISDSSMHWRISTSICEEAMITKQIVDIADPRSHPFYKDASSVAIMNDVARILCLPLLSGNVAVGAIYLERNIVTKNERRVGKEILKAIANYTSKLLASKNAMSNLYSLNEQLRAYSDLYQFTDSFFLGQGKYGRELKQFIEAASSQDTSVLLLGPTGCGKEMVAREIHLNSCRRDGLFVPVNCAALARSVIEAELFGYEEGAFTGASKSRIGRLELAKGGTLFLDEIGDVPLDVQILLLRVLQERVCHRVGGTAPIKLNFRLICATNANLSERIADGTFRQDLFYRINVFPIQLKPLKSRPEDIVPLAQMFVEQFSESSGKGKKRLSKTALRMLQSYDWPGNIRELRNVIERATIISPTPIITAKTLGLSKLESFRLNRDMFWDSCPSSFSEACTYFYRQLITRTLDTHNGSIADAAAEFGVAKCTLYRKIQKLGLVVD